MTPSDFHTSLETGDTLILEKNSTKSIACITSISAGEEARIGPGSRAPPATGPTSSRLCRVVEKETVGKETTVTEKHARRCLFAPLARGGGRHGRRCGSHSLGGPPSHSRSGVPVVGLALRCSHAALHKAATTRGGS